MKVVLDTNCLINIIFPKSKFKNVWDSFRDGKYILCISNEILSEYREIIERMTNPLFADVVTRLLLSVPNVEFVNPFYRFNLITSDPDDNKFSDCAIACGATYIVSDDKHFKDLDKVDWPVLNRRTLQEFAEILLILNV